MDKQVISANTTDKLWQALNAVKLAAGIEEVVDKKREADAALLTRFCLNAMRNELLLQAPLPEHNVELLMIVDAVLQGYFQTAQNYIATGLYINKTDVLLSLLETANKEIFNHEK